MNTGRRNRRVLLLLPRRWGAAAAAFCLVTMGLPMLRGDDGDPSPIIVKPLETITGRSLAGNVSLDPRGYFLVENPKSDLLAPVELGEIKEARFIGSDRKALREGLMFTNDAVLLADITAMDDKTVTYTPTGGQSRTVPRSRVARLQFGVVGDAEWAKVPAGKTGVLLTNGDFFEGTVTGFQDEIISVDSVLFGPAHFNTATRARGAILADLHEGTFDWEIWTSDGCILMADSAKIDGNQVVVNDPWLGEFHLGLKDIQQIRAGSARSRSLGDLKPAAIDPDGPYSYGADATPEGMALDMRGADTVPRSFAKGVYVAAGCSVTWNLAGQFRSFSAVPGIPMVSLPGASVRMIVLVDGKEKYRSDAITSLDNIKDARIINLDVTDAKTLTLRVEGDRPSDVGSGGAFGGASLQKR